MAEPQLETAPDQPQPSAAAISSVKEDSQSLSGFVEDPTMLTEEDSASKSQGDSNSEEDEDPAPAEKSTAPVNNENAPTLHMDILENDDNTIADTQHIEFGTLAEQADEAYYDDRSDADDDLEKGRIKFPTKLYGRNLELHQLHQAYSRMIMDATYQDLFGDEDDNEENEEDNPLEEPTTQDNQLSSTVSLLEQSPVIFLGGISGAGKSALVQEFVKQLTNPQQTHKMNNGTTTMNVIPQYVYGKFEEIQSGDPFAALEQAFDGLLQRKIHELTTTWKTSTTSSKVRSSARQQQIYMQHKRLRKRLKRAEIVVGSDLAIILQDTILPNLARFLTKLFAKRSSSNKKENGENNNNDDDDDDNASKITTDSLPPQKKQTLGRDIKAVAIAFQAFVRAWASAEQPLVVLIDDLQWADSASYAVLETLLQDKAGAPYALFVGAYRSNEVNRLPESTNNNNNNNNNNASSSSEPHECAKLMDKVEQGRGHGHVLYMEITNLSPNAVAEFIADSIGKTTAEVEPIAQAIYAKTLGNIFFVKQALEELVRRNAIYYDVVCFAWQFGDVNQVDLEGFLSNDVVEMVQSKLKALPEELQKILILAAYTKSPFDLKLLPALVRGVTSFDANHAIRANPTFDSNEEKDDASVGSLQSVATDDAKLRKMMNLAFVEGLVLYNTNVMDDSGLPLTTNAAEGRSFKFAHDRIREGACASVPEGPERWLLLKQIAKVLLRRYKVADHGEVDQSVFMNVEDTDDWMLFTAAQHLNSIPAEMNNPVELAELNLRVAKITIQKGALREALVFLKAAEKNLHVERAWQDHYNLILDVKNNLMETNQATGDHTAALQLCQDVFNNARTLGDKGRAHYIHIRAFADQSNKDYDKVIIECLETLAQYGVSFPEKPNMLHVRAEKMKLISTLRGRSLLYLSKLPAASEESGGVKARRGSMVFCAIKPDYITDQEMVGKLKIGQSALMNAIFAKQTILVQLIGYRMIREALAYGLITADLPIVLIHLGAYFRQTEKYKDAFSFTNAAYTLMKRFKEEKTRELVYCRMALHGSLVGIRLPFAQSIEHFLDISKDLLNLGESGTGLAAGMLAMYSYFNGGLPLNAMFEAKLLLMEDLARNLGQAPFIVTFGLFRQCLYNLQGGTKATQSNASAMDGHALRESEVMEKFPSGPIHKMNHRDIAIVRMMLAVIFSDETTMDELLDRLKESPIHDLPVARQHMRMCWSGFASLILLWKGNKKHAKLARDCMSFYSKLAKVGSPNAQPVFACLNALKKRTVVAFEEAIQACMDSGLVHLMALMNEWCGLMLLENKVEQQVEEEHIEYLSCAIWCYHDWGATAKVKQMQDHHSFLKSKMNEKPPSKVGELRRFAASSILGVPRSGDTLTVSSGV